MSKGLKIELNTSAVRDLLRSQEMMSVCEKTASNALSSLGAGYELTTWVGRNRVNASIMAVTPQAIKDNYENNSILKALK